MGRSKPSVLAIWFLPMNAPLQAITTQEAKYANQLSRKKFRQYQHSRGYVREALSKIWEVPALEIPLDAPPGQPPKLAEGWGHVSFSHCCDRLLIGWSPKEIGVDVERADRSFKADQISNRYFSQAEKQLLSNLKGERLRTAVLKKWVNKEAAIKWQRGSLSMDIGKWELSKKSNIAIHNTLGYKIGVHGCYYNAWYIAIAFDNKFHKNPIIICQEFAKN